MTTSTIEEAITETTRTAETATKATKMDSNTFRIELEMTSISLKTVDKLIYYIGWQGHTTRSIRNLTNILWRSTKASFSKPSRLQAEILSNR